MRFFCDHSNVLFSSKSINYCAKLTQKCFLNKTDHPTSCNLANSCCKISFMNSKAIQFCFLFTISIVNMPKVPFPSIVLKMILGLPLGNKIISPNRVIHDPCNTFQIFSLFHFFNSFKTGFHLK